MATDSATVQSTEDQRTSVAYIAMKVPQFIPSDPELWFKICDHRFETSNITSERTKFGHVAGALDPQYALEVKDIMMDPPPQPYTRLREELIKRLSQSQEQKTIRLLEGEEIGDRKPSQFLRHLRDLAGTSVAADLVRTLWLRRLPTSIQSVLVSQAELSLDKVAELADKVLETTTRTAAPHIHEVQSASLLESMLSLKLAQMALGFQQQMADLRKEIAAIQTSNRQSRPVHRSRDRSRSRSRPRPAGGICWYHFTFGQDAQKCSAPCSYQGNAQGSH